MKTKFLFPNYMRPVGLVLLLPGLILGIAYLYFDYSIPGFIVPYWGYGRVTSSGYNPTGENFTNELALILITVGLMFIVFSREKNEDELLANIRLNALYWAILINVLLIFSLTIVLLILFIITKNDQFAAGYGQLSYYNLFTPLIIFIIRYQYLIHRKKDMYIDEKLHYFPAKPYRLLGIVFSIPLVYLTIYVLFNFWAPDYVRGITYFTPVALIIWAYSRRSKEDEFIASLRLQAMLLAIYIYYALLLTANLFLYSLIFLNFINLSPVIILTSFIIVFIVLILKHSRNELKEEALS